jgi:hypothetical protein
VTGKSGEGEGRRIESKYIVCTNENVIMKSIMNFFLIQKRLKSGAKKERGHECDQSTLYAVWKCHSETTHTVQLMSTNKKQYK